MPTFEGTLFRKGTNEPVPGASVTLRRKGEEPQTIFSDQDGLIRFENLTENEFYSLSVELEENLFAYQKVKLQQDLLGKRIDLSPSDDQSGKRFFKWLIGILIGLITLYLILHSIKWPGNPPLSESLNLIIVKVEKPLMDSQDINQDTELAALLNDLTDGMRQIAETTNRLDAEDKAMAIQIANDLDTAIEDDQVELAQSRFEILKSLVKEPPQTGFSIWTDDPWRYIEILMWGLAGILVSKIISIGWYLYKHTYYRSGIWMHLAHLFATPLLVLVVTILLSIATFNITLSGGSELNIDLSDPNTMVVFAFIIGTSPWPLWSFIQDTASRFVKQTENKD